MIAQNALAGQLVLILCGSVWEVLTVYPKFSRADLNAVRQEAIPKLDERRIR